MPSTSSGAVTKKQCVDFLSQRKCSTLMCYSADKALVCLTA